MPKTRKMRHKGKKRYTTRRVRGGGFLNKLFGKKAQPVVPANNNLSKRIKKNYNLPNNLQKEFNKINQRPTVISRTVPITKVQKVIPSKVNFRPIQQINNSNFEKVQTYKVNTNIKNFRANIRNSSNLTKGIATPPPLRTPSPSSSRPSSPQPSRPPSIELFTGVEDPK